MASVLSAPGLVRLLLDASVAVDNATSGGDENICAAGCAFADPYKGTHIEQVFAKIMQVHTPTCSYADSMPLISDR
jgi:hypothetical protein